MSTLRSEIYQKASGAFIQYAIFRWESAAMLAGTIVLTVLFPQPFPGWPGWGWPALGGIGLLAIIASSLTDPETSAKVLRQLLQERLELQRIEDENLRQRVEAACAYQQRIETDVRRQKDGPVRTQLERLAEQFTTWIEQVYRLARYLDTYRRDYRLEERRERLPQEIESLLGRRRFERDPAMLQRLEQETENLSRAWQTLETLGAQMQQNEAQLEYHLAAMARAYSEAQLLTQQESLRSAHADRLHENIQEQIEQLTDLVNQMHALYETALGNAT